MRSAAQRGLRAAISRISAARGGGGRRDGRERRRQKARNPARCQRRIVAGWTSKVASRQPGATRAARSEEHTSELQSPCNIVSLLLLDKKNTTLSLSESVGIRRPHFY